jgi:hypothetical protein
MAHNTTLFEIRSMRDTITHLLEDMLYKAGLANDPEVDKEVSYCLQRIAYQVHDSLPAVQPIRKRKTTTAV